MTIVRTLLTVTAGFSAAAFGAPALALNVFACEPEWGALTRALAGPDADVYVATTALQDVHRIQARPSLIAKYRQADLLACTGSELEIGWLPALAEKGNNPRVAPGATGNFEASKSVTMLELPSSVDRAMGDVHPFGNPHIQTGPQNILPVAEALAARLAELDPPHAAVYGERLKSFAAKWQSALARWKTEVAPLKGVAVVSAHKSWVYLYDFTGLKEIATLEPKPGVPPSAGDLQDVLKLAQQAHARLVIRAAYQDARSSEWLAERAGVKAVELPFTTGGADGTDDLIGLFDVTFKRLLDAAGSAK